MWTSLQGGLTCQLLQVSEKERERGETRRVFYSLVPSEEVTSYRFFPVLFIRRDSPVQPTLKGEESHKGEREEAGSPGTPSGAECGRKCTKGGSGWIMPRQPPVGRPAAETTPTPAIQPPLSQWGSAGTGEGSRGAGWYKATLMRRWPLRVLTVSLLIHPRPRPVCRIT